MPKREPDYAVNERIDYLMKYLKLVPNSFAKHVGIGVTALHKVLKKKTKPGYDTLKFILDSTNVNAEWLLTGEGEMLKMPKELERTPEQDNVQLVPVIVNEDAKQNAFFVPQVAYASYVENFGDPVFLNDLQKYSLPGYPTGTYFVFEVEGDSMSPKVLPKDKVITHQVDNIKWLREGYMHIVVTEGGILLKRPVKKSDKVLTLHSDNDLHKPVDVHLSEVKQILFCYEKISPDLGREANLEEVVLRMQFRLAQFESIIKTRFPDIQL